MYNIVCFELIGWRDVSSGLPHCESSMVLSRVEMARSCPVISMSVSLRENLTWQLHTLGRYLDPHTILTTFTWPTTLASVTDVQKVLDLLERFRMCPGIPDEIFYPLAHMRKGKFVDFSGTCTRYSTCVCFCLLVHVHACILLGAHVVH